MKLKEARKTEDETKEAANIQSSPSNNSTGNFETVSGLGSEPGSDNYALDSMISQYISISSGLRAQLHITELRLASRARVAKRGRELDAESLGTKISSPSKSERAYEIVSRVRKLLSTVDENYQHCTIYFPMLIFYKPNVAISCQRSLASIHTMGNLAR